MDLKKSEIFSLILIILMMFASIAAANMLIPSYAQIIIDFQVGRELIAIPDSLFVLVSAIFAVVWGYYTDKVDRSKVVMVGSFLSCVGFFFTVLCNDFTQLVLARIVTGAGMGCVLPLGYSILGDIIPAEERSSWFGFLAIMSSISNAAGNAMSAFLGPLNIMGLSWKFPFIILSFISIIIIIFLIFVKIPGVGAHEEDLAALQKMEQLDYSYTINKKELIRLLKKPTNRNLILNGFFSIVPGTILIYFMITALSDANDGFLAVLPTAIRLQTSAILAGMTGIGYLLGNIVLAGVGDQLYKKNRRNRSLLATVTMIAAVPLILLMLVSIQKIDASFLEIMNYPDPIPQDQIMSYVVKTIFGIFREYPGYIAYFIFAFLGSFLGAGAVANKNAILIDVNLPEHRGTATSFFQLTEQLGKSITLLLSSVILNIVGSYIGMMMIGTLFWIPAAMLWYASVKVIENDLDEKSRILRERTQLTFIDFLFDLEFALDDGVRYIYDFARKLPKDKKQSEKLLNKAESIFKMVFDRSKGKKIGDIENKARTYLMNCLVIKNDLLMLGRETTTEELESIAKKVKENFEPSDISKIEVLYENAFLKVCEAKLNRKYNIFETIYLLDDAVQIYDRVIGLTEDRLIEEGSKKMSEDELEYQKRVQNLLNNAKKSKMNTDMLKERIKEVFKAIENKGIKQTDLRQMMKLASDFQIEMDSLIEETFGKWNSREIKKEIAKIDGLFKEYDSWQESE